MSSQTHLSFKIVIERNKSLISQSVFSKRPLPRDLCYYKQVSDVQHNKHKQVVASDDINPMDKRVDHVEVILNQAGMDKGAKRRDRLTQV